MARKIFVVLLVAAFSVGMPSLVASAGMGKEGTHSGSSMGKDVIEGTVTKVDGSSVTLRDAECRERSITASDAEELKDIRVGDHVSVKDGRLTKVGYQGSSGYEGTRGQSGPSASFPGENC
ncbi:MAG TPA: hypothetical protein VE080_00460 [Candidatus Aquicultoraceae bacterium]|nr:hypothetical protein [Candidatus Aquicultoraceae bacterium]